MDEDLKDATHAVVSFGGEQLILVDERDREIGFKSKRDAHAGDGVLHRAFSLFVLDSHGRLLLQQRSAQKPLWPLYWSNSCCSHPRRGESMEDAAARRLYQELRLRCELRFLYKFIYHADFGAAGAEHEFCWVYIGQTDDRPRPNANEIAATRYVSPAELDEEIRMTPEHFTPWLKLEWERIKTEFPQFLAHE